MGDSCLSEPSPRRSHLSVFVSLRSQYSTKEEAASTYLRSIEVPPLDSSTPHLSALQMRPRFLQAYEALGLLSCQQENFHQSSLYYQHALDLLSNRSDLSPSELNIFHRVRFQQALSVIPMLVHTMEEWRQIRQRYLENLLKIYRELPLNALAQNSPRQILGCSSLGYYLIYQGHLSSPHTSTKLI
jgi:hypothetical protein